MTANSIRSSNASIKLLRQSRIAERYSHKEVMLTPNPHLVVSSKRNPLHLQTPNKPLHKIAKLLLYGWPLPFNEVVDKAVRFSNKKDASGDEDDPGRPTSNGIERKLFAQERCIVICKPVSVPNPINS
ncbi:hypothetical protein YC2023_022874 [Brassica napus]